MDVVFVELVDPDDVEAGSSEASSVAHPSTSPAASRTKELVFAKAPAEVDWEGRRPSRDVAPAPDDEEGDGEVDDEEERDAEGDDAIDDDARDAEDDHSIRPAAAGPEWLEDAVEEEHLPPRRMSGKAVALALMAVTAAFALLALYARYTYRGDHDTQSGLGLPLRDASAASAATGDTPPTALQAPTATATAVPAATGETASTATTPTPTAAATAAGTAAGASTATTTAAAAATTTTTTATATATAANPTAQAAGTGTGAKPNVVATTDTPPTTTAHVDAPDAAASSAADSFTQQAQKALDNEKDPRSSSRAAELAWKATQRDPSNAEAWLTLGAAYQNLGKKAQATSAYRSCAKQATGPRVAECRALAGMPPE